MKEFIDNLKQGTAIISGDRKELLDNIANSIQEYYSSNAKVTIAFICTHNSRRSQLAECLLDILSTNKEINNIKTLSAGTETTAFNERMVKALATNGIVLDKYGPPTNPLYIYSKGIQDKYYYSKTLKELENVDIMITVCGDADQNCPIVPGIFKRFHLPYKDPKWSDNSHEEEITYNNKVKEIGAEMDYIVNKLESINV